jgi:hypothetical protein
MRALIRMWILWTGMACAGVALAAPEGAPAPPKVSAQAQYKAAAAQHRSGNHEQALALIEQGLAVAPRDRNLLALKARVLFEKGRKLFEQRDYVGALDAYEAYLGAGATGQNRRTIEQIVKTLSPVRTTSLEITVANGPADIYVEAKALGVVCAAASACSKPWLPGDYDVIVERPGFEPGTGPVTVQSGATAKLAITLVEKPSLLTVRVAQPGASVTVDGKPHDAPGPVPAGPHVIVVSLAGHKPQRLELIAREGQPVVREVALTPLVPVQVEPAGAELLLGGKRLAIEDGGVELPPGAHTLVVRAPGFQDREIAVPAWRGADYKLAIALERVVPPPPRGPGLFTGRRKLALAAGGLGVVAAGAGVVLGLQAKQLEEDAYALCPSPSAPCPDAPEANDLNRRGQGRALGANIAFGVAGGAAIAAAVLWFTGAPESRVAVTPRVGAVAGLDLAVRF